MDKLSACKQDILHLPLKHIYISMIPDSCFICTLCYYRIVLIFSLVSLSFTFVSPSTIQSSSHLMIFHIFRSWEDSKLYHL
jgi:hypothetical protein